MIRQLWQKILPVQEGPSASSEPEIRSDLGWHSLKANAGAVLAARLLVPALNVVLIVALARLGGAASLGQYTLLVTLFLLCENLKSLGLTTHMVREIARHDMKAVEQCRSLIRIGMVGALVMAPLIFAVAAHTKGSVVSLKVPALVLSLGLIPSSYIFANEALFLGLGRAHLTLLVAMAENFLRLALSILAVFLWHGDITALCAIYAASRLFGAVVQQILIRRHLHLELPPYNPAVTRAMLRHAPAFATVFAMPLVLFRMDVIFLGVLGSDYQVGVYSAAMRLVTLCLIVPDGIMTATFALLSKLSDANNGGEFKHLVERTVQFVTAMLFPLAAGGALFAPLILRILYGSKFDAAIPIMRTLMWALVPFGINRALGDALVARGEQKVVAKIVLANVAVGATLYMILIPIYGASGAAWAFFFSVLGCSFISAIIAVHRSRIAGGFLVCSGLAASVIGSVGSATSTSTLARVIWSLIAILPAVAGVVSSYKSAPDGLGKSNLAVPASVLAPQASEY